MPRRKPISPTVAPMYPDNWAPAASTSSTSAGDTDGLAAHVDHGADVAEAEHRPGRACHAAEAHRTAATGPYQLSQAWRRPASEAVGDPGDPHLLARRRGWWRW